MTTLRGFALDALPDEPWCNGVGRTRTIANQPRETPADDASDGVPRDWRLSVATIGSNGAFSRFPGVDRTSVLLGEGAVTLRVGPGAP